jgi:hypothetical protein
MASPVRLGAVGSHEPGLRRSGQPPLLDAGALPLRPGKQARRRRPTRRLGFVRSDSAALVGWDDRFAMRLLHKPPAGPTGAFLRAGSKKLQVVARPRRVLLGLGAASSLSDRHSERGPGFRRRLCATATVHCASERGQCSSVCSARKAQVQRDGGLFR